MPLLLVPLVVLAQQDTMAQLKGLIAQKDVDGLTALLDHKPEGRSPFTIIKTGGAYAVGRYGWVPLRMDPKGDRHFIVLTTPLTSEDTGELLFEVTGKGLHYIPEADPVGLGVIGHVFDVKFDLPGHVATLKDRVTFETHHAGLAFFRMGPQYKVDSIDGRDDFTQAGGIVALNFQPGRSTLNLSYHAVVNLPQFAASVSPSEATLANDYWYPMVARQPAPYEVTIHTPPDWVAVGQGELVSVSNTVKERAFQYRMDLPIVYYSLTAGPFKPYEQTIGGRRFSVWSQAMTEAAKEYQTEFYAPIIQFYSDTFGKFPFSGYGAVVSPSYGGGALEAYSYATYGVGWLPAEESHEPSHTWWGGIIPNTYLHSFWNESFADYSSGLYARNSPIGNTAERQLAFIRHAEISQAWNAAPVADAGVDIGGVADALGYGKGSFVLDALENELGTKRMEATLHRWVADHPKGTAGEWEGYEKAVHDSMGEDLTWFFDQWLRRPGAPNFTVSDAAYADGHVTLNVAFDGPAYRMAAEVLLTFADGSQELKRILVPPSAKSVLTIEAREKPKLVSFDPYRRLIRNFGDDEAPPSIARAWQQFPHYDFNSTKSGLTSGDSVSGSSMPDNLNGVAIVGMPGQAPVIAELAARAGFHLQGTNLTYEGTSIDLTHNAAMALIDLGAGKRCLLALGHPDLPPNTGDSWIALTDHLGRFLRGKTAPKLSGRFVFSL